MNTPTTVFLTSAPSLRPTPTPTKIPTFDSYSSSDQHSKCWSDYSTDNIFLLFSQRRCQPCRQLPNELRFLPDHPRSDSEFFFVVSTLVIVKVRPNGTLGTRKMCHCEQFLARMGSCKLHCGCCDELTAFGAALFFSGRMLVPRQVILCRQ
jgi:hypothetical protein